MAWEFLAAIFGAAFIAGGNAKAKQHQQELAAQTQAALEVGSSLRENHLPDRAMVVRAWYRATNPELKDKAIAEVIELCPTFASIYPLLDEFELTEHIVCIILAKYGKITEYRLRNGFPCAFITEDRLPLAKLYCRFMNEYQALLCKTGYTAMYFIPRTYDPILNKTWHRVNHAVLLCPIDSMPSFDGTYVFSLILASPRDYNTGFAHHYLYRVDRKEIYGKNGYCYDENHNLIPI